MKLSENFTLEELTYSKTAEDLNIDNTPSEEIINKLTLLCEKILQPVRDKFGKSIFVTSGYRCPELNKALKGSSTSQHRFGEAADIVTKENDREHNKELFNLIKEMIEDGNITVGQLINEYNYDWIHVSLPTEKHTNQIIAIK